MSETWETRFGIRVIFLCALTLFYLAIEGAEMLPAPLPADSKRSAGAKEPDPGHFRASDQSGTTPLPSCLHSLAPAGECPPPDLTSPCTGLLSGHFHSTNEARHPFP